MQYNISPETFVEGEFLPNADVDDMIDRKVEAPADYTLAANGRYFRKDKQGFLPEMMEKMYNERKGYKKKMLEAEAELELVNERLLQL
jgi:DNA polymerase elongation subunit (family B)